MPEELISHNDSNNDLELRVKELKQDIESRDIDQQQKSSLLDLLEQLQAFDLGRFLLTNQGLNGFWTSYVVRYPELDKGSVTDLERWILEQSPGIVATQQRYKNFHKILNSRLANGTHLASIPCGLMDDLLRLDYSNISDIKLTGVDLDEDSLKAAASLASDLGLDQHCEFMHANAWNLEYQDQFDILVSNGLNLYARSQEELIELYANFYKAIKPGGILLSSFLTPPPLIDPDSPWLLANIKIADMVQQKLLFSDLIRAKWQFYRFEEETINDLKSVGFKDIEIVYDQNKIFPSFTAVK
ncbi:MAG: methyltransferase domain-containing protein [Candidatus Melainabacteria bacterium]|nr:methyltransferase domain-containing protein [Candidatus Melainabacteria bacterium]